MREIPLTRGQVALVDDEDYELVSKYKWQAEFCTDTGTFYAQHARRFQRRINMARLILGLGDDISILAEHRNHDTLDNRRGNLRKATVAQNQYNKHKSAGKSSSYKGVCFEKRPPKWKPWKAYFTFNKKRISLGNHWTEREAALAYNAAAKQYAGEFALLNDVREVG